MNDESDLLTPEEAAAFLKLASVRAFYDWRRRNHVPNRARGRTVRVFKSDLLRPEDVVDFEAYGRVVARGGR